MSDITSKRPTIPWWAKVFLLIQDKLIFVAPGKHVLKVAWLVNLHKIITIGIIYGLMVYYNNFTNAAWIYMALHGIYGYCWLIKDLGFRDHSLEQKTSYFGGINLYVLLIAWYWLIPWLFISRYVEPSGLVLFGAISLHTLGVTTMIAGDGQRHFVLKSRKGLIRDGMFRYTRNPNYLGEIMIYASYAWLADHWIAWAIVAYATISTFLPRMYRKDASISRYPEWSEYEATSSMLIPWRILNGRGLVDRFTNNKGTEGNENDG